MYFLKERSSTYNYPPLQGAPRATGGLPGASVRSLGVLGITRDGIKNVFDVVRSRTTSTVVVEALPVLPRRKNLEKSLGFL